MNITWVMDWPTGKETGSYLALDMGGTNFRVAEITLDGKRGFDVTQSKYLMPENLKVGTKDELLTTLLTVSANFSIRTILTESTILLWVHLFLSLYTTCY